jgi:hypothetical protein
MNSLIVYGHTGFTFDEEAVLQHLQDIPGVYNLERGDFVGAVLQGEYQYKGDRTMVRLSDDLESITIAGTGDASLQLALELQQREEQPLFMTNLGYDYSLSLQEAHTLNEIKKRILSSDSIAVA